MISYHGTNNNSSNNFQDAGAGAIHRTEKIHFPRKRFQLLVFWENKSDAVWGFAWILSNKSVNSDWLLGVMIDYIVKFDMLKLKFKTDS